MLKKYTPLVHKEAKKYYTKYRHEYNGTQYSYEDFFQEAALGFIETLRKNEEQENPLSSFTCGCIEKNIHKNIVRNLMLYHDGIHRTGHKEIAEKQPVKVISVGEENDPRKHIAKEDLSLNDAELRVLLSGLSPLHRQVAAALYQGISRKQLLRDKIVTRTKLDAIIDDLKKALT